MRVVPRLLAIAVLCSSSCPLPAQFWDRWRNPRVNVGIQHPPGLGVKLKRTAFMQVSGACAEQLADLAMQRFVGAGVEVLERQRIASLLAEHRLTVSGLVDQTQAAAYGKILGPSVLVFLNVTRCNAEKQALRDKAETEQGVRTVFISKTTSYLRGSVRAVDLATSRVFAAQALEATWAKDNRSIEGQPEFPSDAEVLDSALNDANEQIQRLFLPWNETQSLVFFDDKECNLKTAFDLLKAGRTGEALEQSERSAGNCPSDRKAKPAHIAHAHYNAGMMNFVTGQYEKALEHLLRAETVRPGDVVKEAIEACNRSRQSQLAMEDISGKSDAVDQKDALRTAMASPGPETGAASSSSLAGASRDKVDPVCQEYVQRIGMNIFRNTTLSRPVKIALVASRQPEYEVGLGQEIQISTGLVLALDYESELAALFGHILGHLTPEAASLSRQGGDPMEREADVNAMLAMNKGGYDPRKYPQMFSTLEKQSALLGPGLKTHLPSPQRMSGIRAALAQLPARPEYFADSSEHTDIRTKLAASSTSGAAGLQPPASAAPAKAAAPEPPAPAASPKPAPAAARPETKDARPGSAVPSSDGRIEIAPGMSRSEVLRVLGPPLKEVVFGNKTILRYAEITVELIGGKVTDVKSN